MVLREQLLFMARGIYDDVQVLCTVADTACHLDDVADIMALHKNIVDVGILDIDAFLVAGSCNPKQNTEWNQTAVCNRLFCLDHIPVDFGELFLILCALLLRDVGGCGKGAAAFFGRERERHGIGIYSSCSSYCLRCVCVGLTLGVMSSFLGIGGGPINLVVLYFFFSMETKVAAQNSLYIILISQITSLLTSLVTASVPQFHVSWLVVMVLGGIAGGMVGRKVNKKLNTAMVDKLFICLIVVIVGISCYNAWRFLK